MNLKVWEKGKGRNSVRTDEMPHYSMVKGCFFIVIRQFNPVDTYRDKFTLHLKTIIQLTARCGIRSYYNLMTIKGLSGIEITVIGACHYGVGLDSEMSIFSEKMGNDGKRGYKVWEKCI